MYLVASVVREINSGRTAAEVHQQDKQFLGLDADFDHESEVQGLKVGRWEISLLLRT